MTYKWKVIGVSGITCGGKTTLVKMLKKKYPDCTVIHQDDYFYHADDRRHVQLPSLNCVNWELMSALDMDKLRKNVKDILSRPPRIDKNLLIIEGFLVLNDAYLSEICEVKLFFTLPLDECRRRRSERTYDPPDVPGYFDTIVWPEYLKTKAEALERNPDIQLIDGMKDASVILNELLQYF